MRYNNSKIVGSLLFVGGVQAILMIIAAETLYPGYSVSENWISDLGVGTTALIFNSSIFLLGVMGLVATYFIQREFDFKPFSALLAIASIGAVGVGLFSEDCGIIHTVFSLITFLFGGLSVILSYKLQKPPLSYFSVTLGAITMVALVLTGSRTYLGLGQGGMERMVAYLALLWVVGFGGYLIGYGEQTITK